MAQRNQMNTFPVTASFPCSATASSTWASVSSAAKTGMEQNNTRQETSTRAVRIGFLYFMDSSFHQSDNGFARKVPTMLVNSRRHQAFINNRKNCPPSIRHQEWKMFPVDWEAPVAKATGAV